MHEITHITIEWLVATLSKHSHKQFWLACSLVGQVVRNVHMYVNAFIAFSIQASSYALASPSLEVLTCTNYEES
jgi:hypothetical protein